MAYKIYLAGPISGLTYAGAQDWREQFAARVGPPIDCYSPLRAKSFLRQRGVINGSYPENPLSCARGILSRDHFDCYTSDLIFCNLLGATSVSIGTVMEIAWAYAYRKPLVVCSDQGNIHDHPMIDEVTNFRCDTLDDGADLVRTILLP